MFHLYVKINNFWSIPPFSYTVIKENNVIRLIILYSDKGLSFEYTYLFIYPELTESDLTIPENKKKSKKFKHQLRLNRFKILLPIFPIAKKITSNDKEGEKTEILDKIKLNVFNFVSLSHCCVL